MLLQPRWNVKWETRLGTHNFAAPVVAGGLVWVGTSNANPDDPEAVENAATLMCFRAKDGKFLWRYLSPWRGAKFDHPTATGILCSPLVEGERLWFTTNLGEVVCLDIAPLCKGQGEPRIVWKLDMGKDLGVRLRSASVMNSGALTCSIGASWQGRLYMTTGNSVAEEEKTVPAPKAPSLLCLDKNTGKVLWSDSSPGKNILRSQRSSPLVTEINGRAQVLAAQGDGWLRSFDAHTGELLWKFDLNPKGAKPLRPGGRGERCFPIATPVLYDNKVYIAIGRDVDDGNGVGHLWCIDISKMPRNKDKDLTPVNDNFDPRAEVNKDSGLVWHRGGPVVPAPKEDEREFNFGRTMSTVAIHDGLVLAAETSGYVQCLDARTGRHYWTYDANANLCSSPLIADGKVYMGTDDGFVHVLALSRERKLLARNDMDEAVNAPAVFANGVLYVVTDWKLYAIGANDAKGDRAPGYWPQWRGPNRSAVSVETGLLARWPEKGPPLAWKFEGLGEGVASVAVASGRVFTFGKREDQEHVTALEEASGKKLWSVPIGPALRGESSLMRWLSQRTPTVDGDRLYAVTAGGELVCLRTADGSVVWRKSYVKDFEGKTGPWGWCDRPLVDDDRLIITPGGKKHSVMALDKKTGAPIWSCTVPGSPTASYAATVLTEVGGVRQYVAFLSRSLAGIDARDGKYLWGYDRIANATGNNYTPLVRRELIFCASGYGKGMALLKLTATKGAVRAEELWFKKQTLPPWHDGVILIGEHVYIGAGREVLCVDLAKGDIVWKDRGAVGGAVSMAAAGGRLYLLSQSGKAVLIEATPKGYTLKGELQLPGATRLVTIERKDMFTLDLSGADVVALYLLPRTSQRLLPQLAQLKPGARIVSHAFEIPGLCPDRVVTYTSKEDDLPHKIYLWTVPLRKAEPQK